MVLKARCMKCSRNGGPGTSVTKDNVIMKTSKGGMRAAGVCAKCGTKTSAMLKKDVAEKAIASGEARKGF